MTKIVRYKNINVSFHDKLEGGGRNFGQEYLRVVKEKIGNVDHVFEFCAGPGFIGFSLLAHGLCNRLTLADVNPEAVKIAEETVEKNKLQDKVSVYHSDSLDSIPESEKWDLVVGNPPHWPSTPEQYKENIRAYDPGLEIHKRFYRDVAKHLKPGGVVLLQELEDATSVEDFRSMIEDNGLEIKEVFKARPMTLLECILKFKKIKKYTRPSAFYFIWCERKST